MEQPTATLIASIVTALGSTAVGVVAVLSAARQSARTLLQQRKMAVDDRLGQQRAELYVELLQLTLYTGGTPEDEDLTSKLLALGARVHAFASDEVMGTFDEMLQASRMPTTDEDERYNRDERLGIQLDNLLSAARHELQIGDELRPSKPTGRRRLRGRVRRALTAYRSRNQPRNRA